MVEIQSSKELKQFTYKIEDQINIKNILDNYNKEQEIYYHASGELDKVYNFTA